VIRIDGGLVVTMDAAGTVVEQGCVEMEADRIVHVGSSPGGGQPVETVDARGLIVVPGLLNTHCHLSQQLGRGLADDVDLLTWLHDRIWPYEAALAEEDVETSALACALEQIRNGVTLVADPGGQHVDGAARGIERAGIRALLGRSTMDEWEGVPAARRETTEEALAVEDELAARWHGAADGRLRFSYTLRTIFNCSDALVQATVERARELGTIVQMHVAEIPAENEHARATRGTSTVRHLARLGALGPWFLGAHAVWLDDEEIALLAETGAAVSHNLASNLRVLGLPRVADMLDAGVVVGLGTDGAPANNRMSLIDELWAASLLQKGLRLDPTVLDARTAFAMTTSEGAKAIGLGGELGSLEAGKAADLVLVDPRTPNMTPVHDPVSALVTSMKTENVHSVMCAGRWLLRERRILVCDEAEVLVEAQNRAEAVARRAGLRKGR
jgi:5-methylthioadenosine/S-adenosylhomocysteine deaminase